MGKNNVSPFFIVGSGRSGSTLLRLILSSHSKIAIPPETWFILPLIKNIPMDAALTREKVAEAVEIITSHYRWPDMGIDKKKFCLWAMALKDPQLRDILNLIYEYHLELEGKFIWGDKTPPYIQIVPELSLLYPDARFIHIVRDGRDVAKSFQNQKWYGKWLFSNTCEWKEAINSYNGIKSKDTNSKMFLVKYEDLVVDTQETIKNICSFLEVSFEPAMLDWTSHARNKIPERELHIHKKIYRRPNKNDIQKWQKEFSLIQTLVAESFLSKELQSVGYDLKYKGTIWAPVFYIVRIYCSVFYFLYSRSKKIYGSLKYDNQKFGV